MEPSTQISDWRWHSAKIGSLGPPPRRTWQWICAFGLLSFQPIAWKDVSYQISVVCGAGFSSFPSHWLVLSLRATAVHQKTRAHQLTPRGANSIIVIWPECPRPPPRPPCSPNWPPRQRKRHKCLVYKDHGSASTFQTYVHLWDCLTSEKDLRGHSCHSLRWQWRALCFATEP